MDSIHKLRTLFVGFFFIASLASAAEDAQSPAPNLTGKRYVSFGVGSYSPDRDPQLADENGKYALAFTLGSRYSRHVAWEIELSQDYYSVNTPPGFAPGSLFGSAGRADLTKLGLGGNVRLIYPLGRFEPYIGGGAGLYWTEIDASTFFTTVKRRDTGPGLLLLAGAEYVFGERGHSLGIQYRKLNLSASFGAGIGDVDVGGSHLLLTYRASF